MPGPAVSRCSHVGSWLRPESVKEARAKSAKGEIDEKKLRELTDPAIADVVGQQRQAGLREISDVSPRSCVLLDECERVTEGIFD